MFYYIKGTLAMSSPSMAVVEAAGVGYKLTISENTYRALPRPSVSAPVMVLLYTWFSVREDGVELFGFMDERELPDVALGIRCRPQGGLVSAVSDDTGKVRPGRLHRG